jgi:hypothetical protein
MAADLGYDRHKLLLRPRPPHHKMRDLTLHVRVLDKPTTGRNRAKCRASIGWRRFMESNEMLAGKLR